jgi:DNA-binding MarR family transcriptional regulator
MVDMSESPDEQPLGYLLARVGNALRMDVTRTVLEPLGLSFPDYLCMRMLTKFPGRSNAELARDIGVSPQAMNTVVKGLQERGLVLRPATVPSGRSLPAELSREARAVLKRTDSGVREAEERILAQLSPERRRLFRDILAELNADERA